MPACDLPNLNSGSHVTLHAVPTYVSTVLGNPGKYTFRYHHFHTNTAIIQSRRNTHAVGPAVSWDASLPFAGNSESMSMAFDWGINAAVLFGRQRAQIHHQTAGYYFKGLVAANPKYHTTYVNPAVESQSLTFGHDHPERRRLRRHFVPLRRCQGQLRLSRRFLLQRCGHRLGHGQILDARFLRPLLHQYRAGGLGIHIYRRAARVRSRWVKAVGIPPPLFSWPPRNRNNSRITLHCRKMCMCE